MKGRIVCAGQALVDCIFTGGRSGGVVDDVSLCPGGEAFNEAVSASRLGAAVLLVAGIGNDPAGVLLNSTALAEGVDMSASPLIEGGHTPVSGLFVDDRGERSSLVGKRHGIADYVPALDGIDGISAVSMASLFRRPFIDPKVCYDFALSAKERGSILLADTKLPKGGALRLEDYRQTLALLDYITPNEQEAAYYTGVSDPVESARIFHSWGVGCVIIKLAERGCYVSQLGGGVFALPAIPTKVIDGIGAGDTFAAGLLVRLCEGAQLYDACRFATACASLCVSHRGAVGGILSRTQVEERMKLLTV